MMSHSPPKLQQETDMTKAFHTPLLTILASSALLMLAPAAHAFDEDAAKTVFRLNRCSSCHAVAKEKKAPSLQKIAKKFAGKPDSMEKLIKHLTSSPTVKLDDGTEEEHKALDIKKAELQNLIEWILAQ
jgi:cytochrome c